jgi:hypothetical protein
MCQKQCMCLIYTVPFQSIENMYFDDYKILKGKFYNTNQAHILRFLNQGTNCNLMYVTSDNCIVRIEIQLSVYYKL